MWYIFRTNYIQSFIFNSFFVGWMHSGYPIMGFVSAVDDSMSVSNLKKVGTWGITHELGHNHQWKSWTVSGTTETGCNWFSLYVHQQVNFKLF